MSRISHLEGPQGHHEIDRVGPVILLGVPGAGKGTQAKRISAHYQIPHISTGDMFRAFVRAETTRGRQFWEYMQRGELVPDKIVCEIVAERVLQRDCQRGFILDGFPRTVTQTEWLIKFLAKHHLTGGGGVVVLYLAVGYNSLFERLSGRLSCPSCGRSYHRTTQPPKHDNVCDFDGATLIQRGDDSPEVIRERLTTYEQQTLPLVEYFRTHGRFYQIDGTEPADVVTERIYNALDACRGTAA